MSLLPVAAKNLQYLGQNIDFDLLAGKRFGDSLVNLETPLQIVIEGMRPVQGAGVQPDPFGVFVPGLLYSKTEQVFSKSSPVKGGDQSKINHFCAWFFRFAL